MNPLITVIIPVYNSAKYLKNCIDSVIRQRNCDIEIILVNDGSTDESPLICDSYATKFEWIHVIHSNNNGVSVARNKALDIAKGKYISFIDSDDEISDYFFLIPDFLSDCDVIQKPYTIIEYDGREHHYPVVDSIMDTPKKIRSHWVNYKTHPLWNKFIKRSVISDIRFIPGVKISEDFLFFTEILPRIHTYAFCNKGMYRYYLRQSSAMAEFNKSVSTNIKITFEHLYIVRSFENNNSDKALYEGLVYSYFVKTLWKLRRYLTKQQVEEVRSIISQMPMCCFKYVKLSTCIKMLYIKCWGICK